MDQKEIITNQLDNDILQCKVDIKRAREPEDADIPGEKNTQKPNSTKDMSVNESVDVTIDESETDPQGDSVSHENIFDDDDLPQDNSPEDTDAETIEVTGLDETEQREPDDSTRKIPRFDLARQILSEQRKVASNRRKKLNGNISVITIPEAIGTVGKIIRQSKKPFTSDEGKEATPEPVVIKKTTETLQSPNPAVHGTINNADNLSGSGHRIIADIVMRDVERFYRKTLSQRPVWQNYPDN